MTVDSRPASQRYDLRRTEVDDVLDRVEKSLQVRLAPESAVRKRRSIGAATDRATWVRIECRGLERLDSQGWGIEAAEVLRDVAKPDWYVGVSWFDPARWVMWRADETSYIAEATIGKAAAALDLPDAWWSALDASMDALAGHDVTRVATPDCEPVTQQRVTAMIETAFPSQVDSTIEEWATAHADLNWANLTGPAFGILDFEDWGRAPRGLDAANLWRSSLSVPEVADKVYRRRRADLECRTGQIMMLFYCAEIMSWADDTEPSLAMAKTESDRLAQILAG